MTLIDEAKQALEGATPGKWVGHENEGVSIDKSDEVVFETGCGCCTGRHLTASDARLIALSPDMARALVLAGELADLVADLVESDSDHRTEWDKDAMRALAAFRAAVKRKA